MEVIARIEWINNETSRIKYCKSIAIIYWQSLHYGLMRRIELLCLILKSRVTAGRMVGG